MLLGSLVGGERFVACMAPPSRGPVRGWSYGPEQHSGWCRSARTNCICRQSVSKTGLGGDLTLGTMFQEACRREQERST